jgi:hypothetical protein
VDGLNEMVQYMDQGAVELHKGFHGLYGKFLSRLSVGCSIRAYELFVQLLSLSEIMSRHSTNEGRDDVQTGGGEGGQHVSCS